MVLHLDQGLKTAAFKSATCFCKHHLLGMWPFPCLCNVSGYSVVPQKLNGFHGDQVACKPRIFMVWPFKTQFTNP